MKITTLTEFQIKSLESTFIKFKVFNMGITDDGRIKVEYMLHNGISTHSTIIERQLPFVSYTYNPETDEK